MKNELRLGNWIESDDTEWDSKKKKWNISRVQFQINEAQMRNILFTEKTEFDFIPLTEQWLKDFGCEKLRVSGVVIMGAIYWRKDRIIFYKSGDKYYMPIGENIKKGVGSIAIQFDKVHELQNIFALTGEELTSQSNTGNDK